LAKTVKSDIVELLKKKGVPVVVKLDPEIQRQVWEFVRKIEKAHLRAGESKLFFNAAVLAN